MQADTKIRLIWLKEELDTEPKVATIRPLSVSSVAMLKNIGNPFYRTRVRSLVMLVTHSLTDSLTYSCLVNFIDVTLACEDVNSKLVEVVTVVDVTAEKRFDDSLVQIWLLWFGHKAKLLFRL